MTENVQTENISELFRVIDELDAIHTEGWEHEAQKHYDGAMTELAQLHNSLQEDLQ